MNVRGRVVIVTGAARGIGNGVARVLARNGARVLLVDRLEREVRDAAAEIAGGEAFACDISSPAANAAMVEEAVAQFGRLDGLVACAAASRRGPFLDVTEEDLEFTLAATMYGAFYSCQAAAKRMVAQGEGGNIVIISTTHVLQNNPHAAAYNMGKSAIHGLARTMASELAMHRIRVNSIVLGWFDTPGELNFATREQLDAAGAGIPLGRLGDPEDVGHAAAYLMSDEASYVTGCELLVDGGLTLTMRAAKSND